MKKKRRSICGRKTSTPPTPAMTPSASKSVKSPGGICARVNSASAPKARSIKSIGSVAHENIAWKTTAMTRTRTRGPNILCVTRRSMRSGTLGRADDGAQDCVREFVEAASLLRDDGDDGDAERLAEFPRVDF